MGEGGAGGFLRQWAEVKESMEEVLIVFYQVFAPSWRGGAEGAGKYGTPPHQTSGLFNEYQPIPPPPPPPTPSLAPR